MNLINGFAYEKRGQFKGKAKEIKQNNMKDDAIEKN